MNRTQFNFIKLSQKICFFHDYRWEYHLQWWFHFINLFLSNSFKNCFHRIDRVPRDFCDLSQLHLRIVCQAQFHLARFILPHLKVESIILPFIAQKIYSAIRIFGVLYHAMIFHIWFCIAGKTEKTISFLAKMNFHRRWSNTQSTRADTTQV